jgi:hypothetical protein
MRDFDKTNPSRPVESEPKVSPHEPQANRRPGQALWPAACNAPNIEIDKTNPK